MDGLKRVNDTSKHHILGSAAIRAFAEALAEYLAEQIPDGPVLLGRWGGDEFLLATVKTMSEPTVKAPELGEVCEGFRKWLAKTGKNGKPNWARCATEAFQLLQGQQRMPDLNVTAQEFLSLLQPIHDSGNPGLQFTAGIVSATLQLTETRPLISVYESTRHLADLVCYAGKRLGRKLTLIDDKDLDLDDCDKVVWLSRQRFIQAANDLFEERRRERLRFVLRVHFADVADGAHWMIASAVADGLCDRLARRIDKQGCVFAYRDIPSKTAIVVAGFFGQRYNDADVVGSDILNAVMEPDVQAGEQRPMMMGHCSFIKHSFYYGKDTLLKHDVWNGVSVSSKPGAERYLNYLPGQLEIFS